MSYQQKLRRWQQLMSSLTTASHQGSPDTPSQEPSAGNIEPSAGNIEPSAHIESAIFICGIEREMMRVKQNGEIADTSHPASLGKSLTSKYITTDFAEALLELVTPTFSKADELMEFLYALHSFVAKGLSQNQEFIWPASMPPIMPDPDGFSIAEYGDSYLGKIKHIYRRGLSLRYGRRMQAIAGIHLNLSFAPQFLSFYNQINQKQESKNVIYLRILRNYMRNSWFINYLLGSSPAIHKSFVSSQKIPDYLQPLSDSTYYNPLSTCLRMGSMGYNNRKHRSMNVCFNTIEEYINTIKTLTHRKDSEYAKIGMRDEHNEYQQLSTNQLQIENEYYAAIRPKAARTPDEKTIDSLIKHGTEYLEIRNLDNDPFLPCGIDEHRIRFMQLFCLYLSLIPSPSISSEECEYNRELDDEIVKQNLNKDKDFSLLNGDLLNLEDRSYEIMQDMEPLADLLDKLSHQLSQHSDSNLNNSSDGKNGGNNASFTHAWQLHQEMLEDVTKLPASKQLKSINQNNNDFAKCMIKIAKENMEHLTSNSTHSSADSSVAPKKQKQEHNNYDKLFQDEVARSVQEEKDILAKQQQNNQDLNQFLQDYIS